MDIYELKKALTEKFKDRGISVSFEKEDDSFRTHMSIMLNCRENYTVKMESEEELIQLLSEMENLDDIIGYIHTEFIHTLKEFAIAMPKSIDKLTGDEKQCAVQLDGMDDIVAVPAILVGDYACLLPPTIFAYSKLLTKDWMEYTANNAHENVELEDINGTLLFRNMMADGTFGASILFSTAALRALYEAMEENVVLIPGSVHEIYVCKESKCPKDLAQKILHNFNSKEEEENIFSDHAYLYDGKVIKSY